jgi:hypothetical protein
MSFNDSAWENFRSVLITGLAKLLAFVAARVGGLARNAAGITALRRIAAKLNAHLPTERLGYTCGL